MGIRQSRGRGMSSIFADWKVGATKSLSRVEGPGRGSFWLGHKESGWELWIRLKVS